MCPFPFACPPDPGAESADGAVGVPPLFAKVSHHLGGAANRCERRERSNRITVPGYNKDRSSSVKQIIATIAVEFTGHRPWSDRIPTLNSCMIILFGYINPPPAGAHHPVRATQSAWPILDSVYG